MEQSEAVTTARAEQTLEDWMRGEIRDVSEGQFLELVGIIELLAADPLPALLAEAEAQGAEIRPGWQVAS